MYFTDHATQNAHEYSLLLCYYSYNVNYRITEQVLPSNGGHVYIYSVNITVCDHTADVYCVILRSIRKKLLYNVVSVIKHKPNIGESENTYHPILIMYKLPVSVPH